MKLRVRTNNKKINFFLLRITIKSGVPISLILSQQGLDQKIYLLLYICEYK